MTAGFLQSLKDSLPALITLLVATPVPFSVAGFGLWESCLYTFIITGVSAVLLVLVNMAVKSLALRHRRHQIRHDLLPSTG